MKKILFLSLISLFAVSVAGLAQERHALVIGVGQYGDKWGTIHADTDVDYVVEMLKYNGFEDIVTLRNHEATKAGILFAFGSLTDKCNVGDKVYIQFSGHGQQITDTNGDEKEDGYDESWIPYDALPQYEEGVYEGENHLVDDEVNGLLMVIKNKVGKSGRILVVVDACHSGDSVRDLQDDVYRGVPDKFILKKFEPAQLSEIREEWITISACSDKQVNWEIKEPAVGKLTWCLYSLKDKLRSLSNNDLMKKVINTMQKPKYLGPLEQTPEMTGCIDTESIRDIFN